MTHISQTRDGFKAKSRGNPLWIPSLFNAKSGCVCRNRLNFRLFSYTKAKNYIAFKECAETLYWLELLYETGYLSQAEYSSIEKDCQELKRMLSSITKTT